MEQALNIVREEAAPCHLKLSVEVPEAEVEQAFREQEKRVLRGARIPGFRPGKAPRSLLWSQYGQQIREAVRESLLHEVIPRVVEQEKVQPETAPVVEKQDELQVERGRSLVFVLEFDVAPEFTLPDYRNIAIADDSSPVEDSQVDDVLKGLLQSRSRFEKVDREARPGDMLKATYKANIDPSELAEAPESAKFILHNESGWMGLRDPEILPGISRTMAGAKAGESREITVEFPDDFFEKTLAGKTLQYKVEVSEVHGAIELEWTDDLAREMGAENVDDVKQKVRQNLEQREEQSRRERQRQEIVNSLLESVDFELPPMVLMRETYELFGQLYQDRSEQMSEAELKEKQDEIWQEADKLARRRLKRSYLLLRIAGEEQIKVEQDEIVSVVNSLSQHHRMPPKKLMKQLQESGRIIALLDDVRANKTLEYIRGILTGEEVPQAAQEAAAETGPEAEAQDE